MLVCVRREVSPRRILKVQVRRSMISKTVVATLKDPSVVLCAVPAFDLLNNFSAFYLLKLTKGNVMFVQRCLIVLHECWSACAVYESHW